MKAFKIITKLLRCQLCILRLTWLIIGSSFKMSLDCLRGNLQDTIIKFPLRVDSEWEIFILAQCITLTPGTLTLEHKDNYLLIHVVRGVDPDEAIHEIRYKLENPILNLFL